MTVTLRASTLLTIGILLLGAIGAAIAWNMAPKRSAHATTAATPVGAAADWKPAASPLKTRFAAAVSPLSARPEYPRPQLVRREWLSLNGLWQFGFDDKSVGDSEGWKTGKVFAERILVPFTFESSLSGIGKGNEVHERVWYRRAFEVPGGWKGKRVLLNFGAVDWEATVYVNGREVGKHQGGYTPFSLDITDALTGSGPQELVVHVYDPSERSPEGYQPRGKQKGSEGIWYTRTTGIWQTVWLEPVTDTHVSTITMTPGVSSDGAGTLALSAVLPKTADGATLEVSVGGKGASVTQTATVAEGRANVTLAVPNAKLWTPESPNLYDLTLKVTRNGKTVDEATSYTAFRSVGIANGRLTLNGKPYFYRGVLDQGYWPDGIYTPPSDEAIRNDVEMTKQLGFNMARKHIKVEDPRWYYWCDRLGVAVWQDMPSPTALDRSEAKEIYRRELTDVIATTQSYPSVVHWIPFNENWGNPGAFQDEMVELTRRLDPSRPITDASGWTQRGLTDVIDAHNYSDSLLKEGVENPVKPKVVGEYGGVGLSVPNHVWQEGRIYIHAPDTKRMQEILRRRTSQLFQAPNLSGYVYTQLTDVEQELNGLLTYDREPKADVKALGRIMRGEDRTKPIIATPIKDWLVLGPISTGIHVSATNETPEAMDAMGRILDKALLPNEGGLQPKAEESATVGGELKTWKAVNAEQLDFEKVLPPDHKDAAVYAVAYLDSPRDRRNATILLGSDDGVVVWLNGKQVYRKVAIRGVEQYQDRITGLTLKRGRNTLVVKVGQGSGGWGLTAHIEKP
jgi:hypothetical protein